jgi:MFS family permease
MCDTPQATDYESYIRKNETWNFAVNLLDLTFYNLALSFIFGSTVLSLYTSYLTSSAMLIGLIPAIQGIGFSLPQLLMARRAARAPRKKPLLLKISVMERLPYLFVALGIFLWPDAPPGLSFGVLALSLAIATGSGGLGAPAWQSMLAKVIPVERRGLLFGLSSTTGGALGIAGAVLSRHVLAEYPYPTSFGICFFLCFVSQAISWICLSLNREPAREVDKDVPSAREYWRRLPSVLRGHPNFARYLTGRALIVMGGMGTAFYVLYARQTFGITDAFAANLTMAALLGGIVSSPLLGWSADRRGHKWLTELSTLLNIACVLFVLYAPNTMLLYPAFMLVNASQAGMFVASTSIIMEFSDADDIPTFSALSGTIMAAPVLLAPILGGWLVDTAGYHTLLITALLFSGLGWAFMRWGVREPRHEREAQNTVQI